VKVKHDATGRLTNLEWISGLVNNVGINVRKPVLEQTEEEYHTMMRTNVDSAYFLCRMFSDLFDKRGATIVNVSSAAGVQSSGTGAAYGMTKAAINQFTRILACGTSFLFVQNTANVIFYVLSS
jgi:Tropinone reductase 1